MIDLVDANVLIGAFIPEDPNHRLLKDYLEQQVSSGDGIGFPPIVEAAFLRITTHQKLFRQPAKWSEATKFLDALQQSPTFQEVHWNPKVRARWRDWCKQLSLTGNDVNDALLAAFASEFGYRLVSQDHGFGRFAGLAWWNPVNRVA